MDFKDLSYILAVEKYGNITKAAEQIKRMNEKNTHLYAFFVIFHQ